MTEKRESSWNQARTMAAKYGCRYCTKRHALTSGNALATGICYACRERIQAWNAFIKKCQDYQEQNVILVDLQFERTPEGVTVTALQFWFFAEGRLAADEWLMDVERAREALIFFYSGAERDLLVTTPMCASILYDFLFPETARNVVSPYYNYSRVHSLLHFPPHLAIPLHPRQKGWQEMPAYYFGHPDMGRNSSYFLKLNTAFGLPVPDDEQEWVNPANVMDRIVRFTCRQQPIAESF